MAMTDVIC